VVLLFYLMPAWSVLLVSWLMLDENRRALCCDWCWPWPGCWWCSRPRFSLARPQQPARPVGGWPVPELCADQCILCSNSQRRPSGARMLAMFGNRGAGQSFGAGGHGTGFRPRAGCVGIWLVLGWPHAYHSGL
jgi:hypothetical protein